MINGQKTLGEAIFVDIESNEYLIELHERILYNYALKLFQLNGSTECKEYNLKDALRFADLLSKSTHKTRSDIHKMWAQEITDRGFDYISGQKYKYWDFWYSQEGKFDFVKNIAMK